MDAFRQIERQRGFRVRPGRDAPLSDAIRVHERSFRAMARSAGGIGSVWGQVIPDALARQTDIVSFKSGILTVRVSDPSVRFAVDRVLRCGALRALEQRAGVGISRVKLVL